MNIRHHVFELVAPATALGAIFVLIVGPLFFPRVYVWFLLIYFTTFLYISVNHFLKFCITVRNIKRNIRNWNSLQEQLSPLSKDYSKDSVKSTGTSSGRTSPIRTTVGNNNSILTSSNHNNSNNNNNNHNNNNSNDNDNNNSNNDNNNNNNNCTIANPSNDTNHSKNIHANHNNNKSNNSSSNGNNSDNDDVSSDDDGKFGGNIIININISNNINMNMTKNGGNGYIPLTMKDVSDRYVDVESALNACDDGYFVHAFVIPNYEEPEPLLRDTIKRLAQHRNASSTYVIVLAMEESEMGYALKGENLQKNFDGYFLDFIITVHPKDLPGESRGKGSNVAYAAREACKHLGRKRIDKKRVVFTITDSDSAIPELYVRQVEKALTESEEPYATICSPPIFFSRNALDVPAAVRVTDIMWSIMVMQNLSNRKGLAFPCSTYSLSMILAEKVGFWDTDKDAVGEDLHMWLKCFFKTGGVARSVPIFVPINLTNVQTAGYISNIYARFVQAKRHYNGVADVAYSLKSAFTNNHSNSHNNDGYKNGYLLNEKETSSTIIPQIPIISKPISKNNSSSSGKRPSSCLMSCSFVDKLEVVFHVLEAHMIPCTSGWLMIAAIPIVQLILAYSTIFEYYLGVQNPLQTDLFYSSMFSLVQVVSIFLPIPLLLCAMIYEGLHKIVDEELFKKSTSETRSWKNYADYIWLPVSAWLFMTLPSTMACVKRLSRKEDEYIVSEKLFNTSLIQ